MRRILIDVARRRNALKRGSSCRPQELHESRIELQAPPDEVLAVHEALSELEKEDARSAAIVKLRYFAGCSVPEIAELLEISPSTVDRQWAFARAWLRTQISGGARGFEDSPSAYFG
jgi:RNA polymerase sigma factor (TIGR02999 family)